MERHSQLVAKAKRTFWNKPVPLPPAPPHVEPGAAAMINGDTSVCGWVLMKGPQDRESQRREHVVEKITLASTARGGGRRKVRTRTPPKGFRCYIFVIPENGYRMSMVRAY